MEISSQEVRGPTPLMIAHSYNQQSQKRRSLGLSIHLTCCTINLKLINLPNTGCIFSEYPLNKTFAQWEKEKKQTHPK